MATRDSNSRKDIAWKYAYLANQNNKNDLIFGKVAKGGANRLKQYLIGGYRAIVGCQKCPKHMKEEVKQYMLRKRKKKKEQINLMANFDDMAFDEEEEDKVAEIDACGKRVQNVGGSGISEEKSRQRSYGCICHSSS